MLAKEDLHKLFKENNTSEKGLTESEVQNRLKEVGANEIKAKKKKPLFVVFLEEFKDLLVIILIIAAILSFVAGEATDAMIIAGIVILNATIGFIQKYKAEKAIEALRKLIAPKARVLREGKELQIDAKALVPGDILILAEGDSITADCILIEANELQAMESALTGESIPVQKFASMKETEGLEIEKENKIFMGTNISHGSGKAIVQHTGMNTQMGRIAQLTTETKQEKSPLEKELFRIGLYVGKISLGISGLPLLIGYFLQGKDFVETLLFAVAVAVAAVPEGLPATITIALAIGVQRLAKKNAIVKQLSAVETLGSATVICTDKTGTLTKNEMTVKEIYFDGYDASVRGVGYEPTGTIHIERNKRTCVNIGKSDHMYEDYERRRKDLESVKKTHPEIYESLKYLCIAAGLCNNANFEKKGNRWKVLGDPTEGALLTMVEKSGFRVDDLKKQYERVHEITFDSTRKRMTVILKSPEGKYFAFTKGAPDSIIDISTQLLTNRKIVKLDDESKADYTRKNENMAKNALRGLGFAYRELTKKELDEYKKTKTFDKDEIEKNLIFIGLVGMIDPPRSEVKEAIKMAKHAYLRIYIITGDHGLTAAAIAKQLDLISDKREYKIITGVELNKLSDKALKKDLANKKLDIIFARVSPEHKLRIVSLLKEQKEIVAVTGDGVNDAPALKKADIGIAMGITGTDVSKEASNMVLADDSFSTIIEAIKEGRTIYHNLKKFVFYIFSCNVGELITVFFAIIVNMPMPLTAILILIINLGTDILPAVALGVDPAEPGIMDAKPPDPEEKIMNKKFVGRFAYLGFVIGGIVMAVYLATLYRYGWSWGEPLSMDSMTFLKGSTIAFVLLVMIQMVNTFNARSEIHSIFKLGFFTNMYLIGAIALSVLMTIAFVEIPFIQEKIHTTSLSGADWGIILMASLLILFIEEMRKLYVRKRLATVVTKG